MPSKLIRDFKCAVAVAASLALGGMYAAPAVANPPDRGSPQWNLMHPFASFITKMHTNAGQGQWCCDWSDGRGDLQEQSYTAEDGTTHYRVLATREAYGPEYRGLIPPEGKWIDIPPEAILSSKDADAECKVERTADPNSTCKTPDFNILWISTSGHVYCYWPQPKMGSLEDKYRQKTGNETKVAQIAPAPAPAL